MNRMSLKWMNRKSAKEPDDGDFALSLFPAVLSLNLSLDVL